MIALNIHLDKNISGLFVYREAVSLQLKLLCLSSLSSVRDTSLHLHVHSSI